MSGIEERVLAAVQLVSTHDHMTVQVWPYEFAKLLVSEADTVLVSFSGYVVHNGLEQLERQSEQRDRLWEVLRLRDLELLAAASRESARLSKAVIFFCLLEAIGFTRSWWPPFTTRAMIESWITGMVWLERSENSCSLRRRHD